MLRKFFEPPPDLEQHPLFGPDSQGKLRAIEESQVWQFLKQGLAGSREALFASHPTSTEDLWRTWGALETLTTLLHQGPITVLQYSLLAAKTDTGEEATEREYKPTIHGFQG